VTLPTLPLPIDGWCLRAWHASDAPALAKHANNEQVWRNMSDTFPHPYTLEIARHWATRGHVEFGGDNWAIDFHGEAVGGCGVRQENGPFRCNAEIGYWLAQEHWGKGVVTQVARALTEYAFAMPEVSRIYAPVHAYNPTSMRVLEKNGFVCEGVIKQSAFKAGQLIDRVLWARYKPLENDQQQ
jgi:RimJ/RimL family protein N-acetyltransferase